MSSGSQANLRSRNDQHEKREDRPDVQAWIDLDERIAHVTVSFRCRRAAGGPRAAGRFYRLLEHDQETEHFRENRHAFEQEERQVRRARDLRRRAGLPCDALGHACGELADAQSGADDGETEPKSGSGVTPVPTVARS